MKKEYVKPELTIARFEATEYLTCSGGRNNNKCTVVNCAKIFDTDKRF